MPNNEGEPIGPYVEVDQKKIYPGDPVVVVRVMKEGAEPYKYEGVEYFGAVYYGNYAPPQKETEMPLIALILPNGIREFLWDNECDWMHPESYKAYCDYFERLMQAPNN